jgi:hypothetical protein
LAFGKRRSAVRRVGTRRRTLLERWRSRAPPQSLTNRSRRTAAFAESSNERRAPIPGGRVIPAAARYAPCRIALPKAVCDQVYATSGYEASVTNLSRVTLANDMVFADGDSLELATITGSVSSGLTASLTVAV